MTLVANLQTFILRRRSSQIKNTLVTPSTEIELRVTAKLEASEMTRQGKDELFRVLLESSVRKLCCVRSTFFNPQYEYCNEYKIRPHFG